MNYTHVRLVCIEANYSPNSSHPDDLQQQNQTSPIWRCAGFFKALLKFKMAAMDDHHNFFGRKNAQIEVRNNSHFPITKHTICKYAGDSTVIKNDHHKSTF